MVRLRNKKQELFCNEYLIDRNATQAAIRAGYSEKWAKQGGAQLMGRPLVAKRVDELTKRQEKRARMSADRILDILETIIETNVTEFMVVGKGNRVKVIPTDQVDEDKLVALAGVKKGAKGAIEVKTYNKLDALQLIMRHKGMLTDKTEHSGEVKVTVELTGEIEKWGK